MDRDIIVKEMKVLMVEELELDLNPEEIDENLKLTDSDVHLDSLDFLTIAAAVEDKYDVRLDFKSNESLLTVSGIVEHIMKHRSV